MLDDDDDNFVGSKDDEDDTAGDKDDNAPVERDLETGGGAKSVE